MVEVKEAIANYQKVYNEALASFLLIPFQDVSKRVLQMREEGFSASFELPIYYMISASYDGKKPGSPLRLLQDQISEECFIKRVRFNPEEVWINFERGSVRESASFLLNSRELCLLPYAGSRIPLTAEHINYFASWLKGEHENGLSPALQLIITRIPNEAAGFM